MRRRSFLAAASLLAATAGAAPATRRRLLLYIGTQAAGPGKGIATARLDERTGALDLLNRVTEVARPTWLLADPRRPVLYSVSEVGYAEGENGEVLSFAIDQLGNLRPISRVSSGGRGPAFLGTDRLGSTLFVAHYGDGKVAAIPVSASGALDAPFAIAQDSGSGPDRRQSGPHAHAAIIDPTGRFVAIPDLGADRVFLYRLDPEKRSIAVASMPWLAMPPGSGPRHLVFAPDGRNAFLLTELTAEIHTLGWDGRRGELSKISSIALDPADFVGARSGAEIGISADGRFVYASNRAINAIHVFEVQRTQGTLMRVQTIGSGGTTPWSFALSPGGDWMVVANQGSNSVTTFAVDRATGRLSSTGVSITVDKPVAIAFSDRGR